MFLAYSFSIDNEDYKKSLVHHIEDELKETSISYEIKVTKNIEVWISKQEDLEKITYICKKINCEESKILSKIKENKFFKNRSLSSYGIITLIILGISLFIGIQVSLTKNKEIILNTLSLDNSFNNTSYVDASKQNHKWIGLYNYFFLKKKYSTSLNKYSSQLLPSLSQKHIWPLLTSSLIHYGLLATFFNCFWFAILGNSVEIKIGKTKFLILVLVLGLCTNFLQYLMTGPSFHGLSGIISGLVSFILVRKKNFPWEAYNIQKETLVFIIFCIGASLVLQSIITLAQISGKSTPFLSIPNTSLLTGLIIGYLFGKTKIMQISEL